MRFSMAHRFRQMSFQEGCFRQMQILPSPLKLIHCGSSSIMRRAIHHSSPNASRNVIVDLRSDTLTLPTDKIREAIAQAEVGDDVFREDKEVKALQWKMAELLGMEDSLYVPSGTMGNLLAVMVHCQQRGSEVMLGHKSHMFRWAQGNMAHIAGVQPNPLTNRPDGTFCLDELQDRIQADDEHCAITSLICIENTQSDMGGKILPQRWLDQLRSVASKHGIPVHVDGARLLNASVGARISPAELIEDFDSVTVCLSKGVGAPIGSVLAGDRDFIAQARRYRKAIGGGVRQIGFMARGALVALEDYPVKLAQDNRHAKMLAKGVQAAGSASVTVDVDGVHSNIVLLNTSCITPQKLMSRLRRVTESEKRSVGASIILLSGPLEKDVVRLVTSCNQTTDDIELAVQKLHYVIREIGRG